MLDAINRFWNYKTTVGDGVEISVKAIALILILLFIVSFLHRFFTILLF